MFSGQEVVEVTSPLPEEEFYRRVEEALKPLGRTRVDKRGGISVEPKESLKSFMSELSINGTVRRRKGGEYEVEVSYSLSPSMMNWVLTIVLFVFTCIGAVVILAPMLEKGKVSEAINRSLTDLEDSAGGPALKE